jgi:hypothetical protein
VGAALLGQLGRGLERREVDLLLDAGGQGPGLGAVEGQAQGEEDVLQPHQPQTHRPPAQVAAFAEAMG